MARKGVAALLSLRGSWRQPSSSSSSSSSSQQQQQQQQQPPPPRSRPLSRKKKAAKKKKTAADSENGAENVSAAANNEKNKNNLNNLNNKFKLNGAENAFIADEADEVNAIAIEEPEARSSSREAEAAAKNANANEAGGGGGGEERRQQQLRGGDGAEEGEEEERKADDEAAAVRDGEEEEEAEEGRMAERDQAALARALTKEALRRDTGAGRAKAPLAAPKPVRGQAVAQGRGAGENDSDDVDIEALEALSDEENDTRGDADVDPGPPRTPSRTPSPRLTGRRIRKLSKTLMSNLKHAGKAFGATNKNEDEFFGATDSESGRERASTGGGSSIGNASVPYTSPSARTPPGEILHGFERIDADLPARHPNDLPEGCVVVGYHVQSGDTINGVAMRHGMTVGQFRQLNKMFGSASLFPGQVVLVIDASSPETTETGAAGATRAPGAEAVGFAPPPLLVRQRSKLGGEIYEGVTLLDKKIQVGGSLEVNSYYVLFNAASVVDAEASAEVRASQATARLAKSYQFRLDIRDIQGCSASEMHAAGKQEDGEAAATAAAAAAAHLTHDFCLRIYWTHPSAGFGNPPPLTFFADDHETCAALVTDIQTQVQKQREKSARLVSLKIDESESITGGALLSGLLCKPDQVSASANEGGDQPVDLVQQALLNGEITEEEAAILRLKNREVEDRMAALAEAQRAAKLEQAARSRKASSPLTIMSAKVGSRRGSASSDGNRSQSPPERKLAIIDTKVLPHFSGPASMIVERPDELIDINRELPDRLRNKSWVVSYSSHRHGVSLKQLYRFATGHTETLLLFETRSGERFGCFATEQWTPTRPREFYGTGESFVFSLRPDLRVYKWTGANDFIMSSSASHLGMGGGGGFAFCLDEDLDCGTASRCETFGNLEPILAEPDFRISQLELITFENRNRNSSISSESEVRYLFSPDNSS